MEIARSTSRAAVSTVRAVPHDGQKPRPLHENATPSPRGAEKLAEA